VVVFVWLSLQHVGKFQNVTDVLILITVLDLTSASESAYRNSLIPFVSNNASVTPAIDIAGRHATTNTVAFSRQPLCNNCSPSRIDVDGPILFEAPPLVEETLMDVSDSNASLKGRFLLDMDFSCTYQSFFANMTDFYFRNTFFKFFSFVFKVFPKNRNLRS